MAREKDFRKKDLTAVFFGTPAEDQTPENKAQEETPESIAQDSPEQIRKKKAIHIEVSAELHTRLKTLAAEQGISIKDLVINTLTERYAKELKR